MRKVAVGRHNLFSDRRRAALGITGVAVALLLILALDAVFAGAMKRSTAYIDSSKAEVFVSQRGVRNMHMTSSAFAGTNIGEIREISGVRRADPVLFETDAVQSPRASQPTYVIGYERGGLGGPTTITDGREPGPGEAVLDEEGARAIGVGVGDAIETLGRTWRVSGLTSGVSNFANTITYVRLDDFAAARRLHGTVSYVLVQTDVGPRVIHEIERTTGLTAMSRTAFHAEERRLIMDMSTDLLRIMTLLALLIGLVVVSLTLYAATLSRLREIGVMKAIGATWKTLAATVLSQAMWTVGAATVLALMLVFLAGFVVSAVKPNILLVVEWPSFARVAVGALVLGAIGSLFPLVKVSRVDPATVFRRSS